MTYLEGNFLELKNMIVPYKGQNYSDIKNSSLLFFWFCYSYTCNTSQFLECKSANTIKVMLYHCIPLLWKYIGKQAKELFVGSAIENTMEVIFFVVALLR